MLKKCDKSTKHGYKLTKHGSDQSEKIMYTINSLGFRGEEYNTKAKKHIFVFGCSYTFGTGLNIEETWAYQFKKLFSHMRESDINDINLMNFSVYGVSNDHITRNFLIQCNEVKPDLAIVLFSKMSRTEYLNGKDVKGIGIWGTERRSETIRQEVLDYYTYYTDQIGFVNLVKNILLVQNFCNSKKIDYIFCIHNGTGDLVNEKYLKNPVCSQLVNLIDRNYLCDFGLEKIDVAADNEHPGPKSNKLFAEKLFKFYEEKITNH
ncbi:hypothetical protein KY331_00230 [Candidatus Woesearchaeota archaeon]|nr:hypothetical protein [Candidatus Woesearchaeota archaeon]